MLCNRSWGSRDEYIISAQEKETGFKPAWRDSDCQIFFIILTSVKVSQKDFIQGSSAMVFFSRGERLSTTLNKTKVGIYSQEASWVVSGWTVTKRVGGFLLRAGQEAQISLRRIQGDKELDQILRVIRYDRGGDSH